MATTLSFLSDTFWSSNFWIEGNATWADLEAKRESGILIALPRDLLCSFPLALFLVVLRLLHDRLIAIPIGRYFRMRETHPKRAVHNYVMEKAFKRYGKYPPNDDVIAGIAKQADWRVLQVQRWWRRRRLQLNPSNIQKFKEVSWRFLFYLCSFWYGINVLWDKDYFWNVRRCWDAYPYQTVTLDIYWYYMFELGFYWSLIITMSIDYRRKDFAQNIAHHIATIALMLASWCSGMFRLATLSMVLHDATDYWMEAAKLLHYSNKKRPCHVLFLIFAVIFFVTRLIIFPWKFLYSSYYDSVELIGHNNYSWIIFFTGMYTLQVLHIFWFYMILRMLYRYVVRGDLQKDDRSETEPDTHSDDNEVIINNDTSILTANHVVKESTKQEHNNNYYNNIYH